METMERTGDHHDCDRCRSAEALFFVHRASGQSVRLCAGCKRQVCDAASQWDRPTRRLRHAA